MIICSNCIGSSDLLVEASEFLSYVLGRSFAYEPSKEYSTFVTAASVKTYFLPRILTSTASILLTIGLSWIQAVWAGPPILELQTRHHLERGVPIYWGSDRSLLLKADGAVESFLRDDIIKYRKTNEEFRAISPVECRSNLHDEFGKKMQIAIKDSYVVVAQNGKADRWLATFTQLDTAVVRYFSTRGFPLRVPEFPLIAIVFPNQESFLEYSRKHQLGANALTLGMYSPMSNRMLLFETATNDRHETLHTILHEATHQIAFNRGIHQRLSDYPLWAVEGLASVFESPAMLELSNDASNINRWNPVRFATWQVLSLEPSKVTERVRNLIISDDAFESQPDQSYAVAWALTFYLSERHSEAYVRFMKKIASNPPGMEYSAESRKADFQKFFTSDIDLLVQHAIKFFAPKPRP